MNKIKRKEMETKYGRGINNDKSYVQVSIRVTMSKEKYIKYRMLLISSLVTQDKFINDLIDEKLNQLEKPKNAGTQRKVAAQTT